MRVISRKRLREFGERFPDATEPLDAWYRIVTHRDFRSPAEVKEQFGSASMIGGTRMVFNIAGNKYRLVVDVRYDLRRIYIRHVLTHREYDELSREGNL
jgi:mRNA interferase HigB